MTTERVSKLFNEYTASFARGEHPDPTAYLADAGEGVNTLRELIDGFLQTASAPAADPGLVAMFDAWIEGRSPLLELRTRKGATRGDVVDALAAELGIDASKRTKLARYYHLLETGLLNVSRIDARVFTALAKALGARVSDLVFPGPPATAAAGAYLRSSDEAEEVLEVRLDSLDASAERDEVDDLFCGSE